MGHFQALSLLLQKTFDFIKKKVANRKFLETKTVALKHL